jgi:hypothetical protein
MFADETEGLCTMGGADDAGTDIDAYFEPITTDLGVISPKQGRYIHLGFETDGALEIDVAWDGKTAETISIVPQDSKTGQQRITVPIQSDSQGRYITTQIRNVDGADFSIDSYDIDFYALPQRIQDY